MSDFILAAQANPALVPAIMLISLFLMAFVSVTTMALFEAYRIKPKYRSRSIRNRRTSYGR